MKLFIFRGRTPEWYNKSYGHIAALHLSKIRNSFKHTTDGPESKVWEQDTVQHQLLHGSTSSSSSMFLQVPDEQQYDHRILKEVRQIQPTIDEE